MRVARLVACLTGLAIGPALAQDDAAHFPAPPDGFDALHASDAARAHYGLPAQPARVGANGGAAYTAWARAMASARQYVVPEIRIMARRHGPERMVSAGAAAAISGLRAASQTTSTNWTGEALVNRVYSYGSGSFNEVLGLWLLPSIQQAVGTCSGTDVSAIWIGIDGAHDASNDVLQAGTEGDVSCSNGVSIPAMYPWFEWYPNYTYEVSNFPLTAGDSIFVTVQATSATTGQAMFVNLKTGAYTTTPIYAPSGTRLIGNTAEWIMERPTLEDNQLGTLADFGVAMMCYELVDAVTMSGAVSPGTPTALQTSYLVNMLNANGVTVAESAAMGPTGQAFSVQGPTK